MAAAPAFSRPPASSWSACGSRTPRRRSWSGLRYRPGQTPLLTREWTSDAVGGGPLASPVLSADGSTVYVNGRDEHLWALNTADGKPKWSVPLDYLAQTPPSVSPDGLIVAGGGPEAKLVAITRRRRPRRGGVDPRRRRAAVDVEPGRHAASATPWRSDGENGQALLVFDPADGHTVNSYPLPDATRLAGRGVGRP